MLELEHSVRRTHIGSKPRGVARSCKPGCNAFVDVQALRNDLVNVDISIQKTYCSFRCGMHDRDRLAMDREPESQRRVNRTRPLTPAIIEWLEWVRRRVEWSRGCVLYSMPVFLRVSCAHIGSAGGRLSARSPPCGVTSFPRRPLDVTRHPLLCAACPSRCKLSHHVPG